MAQAEQLQLMTPEAYLAFEQQADQRHEYVNGLIVAMAGASRRRNLLTLAFASLLRAHLQGSPCRAYSSDMKVNASHKGNDVFYYPDVMVACNDSDQNAYVEDQPTLIAEVLSPTTEARDRMEKLAAYTAIKGLKEYVLIHQDKIAVDLYQSTDSGWEIIRLKQETDTLQLHSIGFSVTLRELYEDVVGVL
ncbi:Uma2 family endonuclease [Endozoicomonas sp. GU-1]|uniref:Uma2 family endonuclease n=1 Tax=Endozoicomonas sp. GU-1 TaxID=3009078 RepID=UPI0022B321B3|nr:Uma2 family endonuclease [Endozoicomonas sp. GU-1]WBA82180.1 Uma2 family endonuclease [Endozoicomonas sp. GU-1]WBA85120.1 Uma2 family endonuclease [Endozoicomonas sp. GU-1]